MTAGISNALLTQGLQRFLTAIAGGQIIVYSAPRPAKGILFGAFVELARFQLPNPAGVISSGQLVLSPVPGTKGVAQGIPTWCRWIASDSSFVLDCDVPADIAFSYGPDARIDVGSTVTLVGVQVGAATFNAAQLTITEADAIAAFTAVGNRAPVANSGITQINLVVGGPSYDMRNLFTDPDGDPMTYVVVGGSSQLGGFSALNGATGFLAPVAAGTVNVQFTADDGKATAPPPLAAITYLGALQLPLDPTDGVTRIKFGPRAQFISVGPDGFGKVYQIGGSVQQAGHALSEGGSNTLFSFDPYNNWAVAIKSPYYISNTAQIQPQHPDGAFLGYSQLLLSAVVIPGRMLDPALFGGWPAGKAAPIAAQTHWDIVQGVWKQDHAGPLDPSTPSPWLSQGFFCTSGGNWARVVVGIGASCRIVSDQLDSVSNDSDAVSTTYYTFVGDPSLFNQWWDSAGPGEVSQSFLNGGGCFCFDWVTGKIVMVYQLSAGTYFAEVRAALPPLSASTDPFVLTFDGLRRRLVAFYRTHVYVIDCDSGVVTDAGAMPITTTGFRVGFYETESDTHVVTGEDAGSDSVYRFQLPALPITPLPIDTWYENDVEGIEFSHGHVWKWQNTGGDWWDANGIAQGPTPFDQNAAVNAVGVYTFNVLGIYQQWVSLGVNTGIAFRNDGSDTNFGGRKFADPTKRPTLTVVSSTGTFICPCIESTLAQGTLDPVPQQSAVTLRPNGCNALLRFDISAVTGIVSAATLNLWCTTASGPVRTVKIYRPRTPLILDHDAVGSVVTGFAALYNNDGLDKATGTQQMSARSGVLAVSDMSTGWQTRLKVSPTAALTQTPSLESGVAAFDARFNSIAKRVKIAAYTVGGPNMQMTFANYGVPDQDEFNFRHNILWEQDYVPQISGVKGPVQSWFPMTNPSTEGGDPISGLMSPRNTTSQSQEPHPYRIDLATNRVVLYPRVGLVTSDFQSPYSNASPPPDGAPMQFIFLTPPPGIVERQVYFVRNATYVSGVASFQISTTPTGSIFVFTGPQPNFIAPPTQQWWSPGQTNRSCVVLCDNSGLATGSGNHGMDIRLNGGMDFMETYGNLAFPKDKSMGLISFLTYNYDPVQRGGGGYPDPRTGVTWGSPAGGYTVARREKLYTLEVHMKMNTVSGPFDSFGNGKGNADGISEYYFNGHLTQSHTDRLFRHHPNIKFQYVRWVQYHGGTWATQSCFHTRIGDFVLAVGPNNYIGPKG